ncbi:hypothetical protein [Velocimicrobium porci]|uniref:Uncharacterized protein n=1 Tax=Velocimicrobium porci TaxID=2606634 RepID=A0A6L5XWX7_9FIRM|nr:hypothetical protein [Velocimicrobium porci]MSS63119.1 hypothetical protein [Velocimicrobium porci]
MDYFLVQQKEMRAIEIQETLQEENVTICKVKNIGPVEGLDYIQKRNLVSNRFKELLELYQPKEKYQPYVYISTENQQEKTFWHWNITEYQPKVVQYRIDGLVQSIEVDNGDIPRMFYICSPKGIRSIIVHLSIAESVLRRGYLGLEFVPVG